MLKLKNLDVFGKNIILVFLGTSLANFLNLLYQLLIAHKFSAQDFAAFNSLLSIYMLISAPLGTLSLGVAKFASEFNAHGQADKIRALLSGLLKKLTGYSLVTLLIFWFSSRAVMGLLKIPSVSCGYLLAALLFLAWFSPVFAGAVQGLEFFGWLAGASIAAGVLKLALTFAFIVLGFKISGALGALLISVLAATIVYYFPLRQYIGVKFKASEIKYREIFFYLLPVTISNFCYIGLVSFDMVLVKYFFLEADAGSYSIAQMVGKIILFLPAAISIVMFPKTSGLHAKKMDTRLTLKRSLIYVALLCVSAVVFYNFFPSLVLKVLTGKASSESILLGRLFGLSMTAFALLYILVSYFLSIKDWRFIKYLIVLTVLQFLAISLWHEKLLHVQLIMCFNAALLLLIHLILSFKPLKTYS